MLLQLRKLERKGGAKMDLKLKSKTECKYDEVSLGEIMLRLDPGEGRIRNSRNFRI